MTTIDRPIVDAAGPLAIEELPEGAYLPDEDQCALDRLLEKAFVSRLTAFFTVFAECCLVESQVCANSGFESAALALLSTPIDQQRAIICSPPFNAWISLSLRALHGRLSDSTYTGIPLISLLKEFAAMLERVKCASKNTTVIDGTRIAVQRFDIDPVIKQSTPPSYVFPQEPALEKELSQGFYPATFIGEIYSSAIGRIRANWPELFNRMNLLVSVIGYVPDATFRSCSASRFAGVIYIAAKDSHILDLEESIVHEVGHQILYKVVEVGAIVKPELPADYQFTLPWSGNRRDLYGYFHAFYIYVLLAQYYSRVCERAESSTRDRERALGRRSAIVRGLVEALPDFNGNPFLTDRGTALFNSLKGEVASMSPN